MQEGKLTPHVEGMIVRYVRILVAISIAIVFAFCVYHSMHGEHTLAIVEGAMFVVFSAGLIALSVPSNVRYVMHMMMAVGLAGALFNMRIDNNTVMWMGALIIGAFTLFSRKEGIVWAVIVNISVIVFMLFDYFRETPSYSPYFAINVVLSCLWLSMIAYFAYRNKREQHEWTLEEEAIRERKKMAQTLAGGMAHVMNNEMLAIVGRLECLQFRTHRKEDAKELEEIVELAMKVSDHGNRLALYAQPEEQQNQRVHLYDTCKAVVQQHEKSLPSEIEIKLNKPEFPKFCHGDEVQIAQALAQIIENAHDAIAERWKQRGRESEGHIGITLSQENIELKLAHGDALQSGLYTCITVSDDGWGVPEDMQEQVFNPFTTSKRAGRGLGLAVAKSIVQRHGGQVSFESDVGKGSLFRMYLPMIETPS